MAPMHCARKALPDIDFKHDPAELERARQDCIKALSAARLLSLRCGTFTPLGMEPEEARLSRERFEARMMRYEFREAILGWSYDLRTSFCQEWLTQHRERLGEPEVAAYAHAWLASLLAQIHPFAPHLTWFLLPKT